MYRYTIRHKGRIEAEGTVESTEDMQEAQEKYEKLVRNHFYVKYKTRFAPTPTQIAIDMMQWCIVLENKEPTPCEFRDIMAEIRRRPELCHKVKKVLR